MPAIGARVAHAAWRAGSWSSGCGIFGASAALELVRAPAHRSTMLGVLARAACRQGDAAGAEGWLRAMDPRSDRLPADSDYRISHAVYFTLVGDPARVLSVLGAEPGQVPIHTQRALMADVFRANAYACLGDRARAMAHLERLRAPLLVRAAA